jgi:hypothetical protein
LPSLTEPLLGGLMALAAPPRHVLLLVGLGSAERCVATFTRASRVCVSPWSVRRRGRSGPSPMQVDGPPQLRSASPPGPLKLLAPGVPVVHPSALQASEVVGVEADDGVQLLAQGPSGRTIGAIRVEMCWERGEVRAAVHQRVWQQLLARLAGHAAGPRRAATSPRWCCRRRPAANAECECGPAPQAEHSAGHRSSGCGCRRTRQSSALSPNKNGIAPRRPRTRCLGGETALPCSPETESGRAQRASPRFGDRCCCCVELPSSCAAPGSLHQHAGMFPRHGATITRGAHQPVIATVRLAKSGTDRFVCGSPHAAPLPRCADSSPSLACVWTSQGSRTQRHPAVPLSLFPCGTLLSLCSPGTRPRHSTRARAARAATS